MTTMTMVKTSSMIDKPRVKYFTISDVHLNHPRNKTVDICKALTVLFEDFKDGTVFSDLDIIFIAGDMFHTLMDCSGNTIHDSIIWMSKLMRFCSRNKIKLRILEGTPSHDWQQMELANTLDKILNLDLDVRYIQTLHIEKMEDLDLTILYIPDEWAPTTADTMEEVKELMFSMNLQSVDIAQMHGFFGYQLPNVASNEYKHDEAFYLAIVKHYINIGHVHTFSTYDRIIAQGSTDRLAHGEEEPKGGVLCDIRGPDGDSFIFVENKLAKIFRTIELKSKDIDKCLKTIENKTKNDPVDSFIRIKATKDHPIYIAFDELKLKFPQFNFSKVSVDDDKGSKSVQKLTTDHIFTPITITEDNVINLIMDEVSNTNQLDPLDKEELEQLLITVEM